MFACSGPLTVSRPGFFFDPLDRGGGGGGAPEAPLSTFKNIKATAMKLWDVYKTSEMVFFEVHIIS